MGRTKTKIFRERFGDRICIQYSNAVFSPSEQEFQNKRLVEAIQGVMAGILKRQPAEDELLGLKKINSPKFKGLKK